MLATKFKASPTHAPTITVTDKWSRSHFLRYAVVVVGCCLGASPARAEMLLAEISFTAPEPVVAPASFRFGVNNSFAASPLFYNWIETVPSFPFMSMADATTLAEFDRLLTTTAAPDRVGFGFANGANEFLAPCPTCSVSLDQAFMGAYVDRGVTATRYAEPLSEPYTALTWYALTAIERNVTPTIQTIRIFGYPDPPPRVPEPSTAMLVLCAALLYVSMSGSSPIYAQHRCTYRRP